MRELVYERDAGNTSKGGQDWGVELAGIEVGWMGVCDAGLLMSSLKTYSNSNPY